MFAVGCTTKNRQPPSTKPHPHALYARQQVPPHVIACVHATHSLSPLSLTLFHCCGVFSRCSFNGKYAAEWPAVLSQQAFSKRRRRYFMQLPDSITTNTTHATHTHTTHRHRILTRPHVQTNASLQRNFAKCWRRVELIKHICSNFAIFASCLYGARCRPNDHDEYHSRRSNTPKRSYHTYVLPALRYII